jgi:hypothetical protein
MLPATAEWYLMDYVTMQVNAAAETAGAAEVPYPGIGQVNTLDTGERFADGWRAADRQRTQALAMARTTPAGWSGR